MRHLQLITNSAVKTFGSCPRSYQLSYVDLVKPVHAGEALVFGDLLHKSLEAWWLGAKAGVPQDERLSAAIAALQGESDPYRRGTLEALMIGYHERWKALRWEGAPYDGEPIEVVAVEQEFTGPLINPSTGKASKTWQRSGKIDALIRVAGDVWVLEHKSSSEDFGPGSPYRARLKLDTQVSGYHVGARLLGHQDVKGVLYDVIGKPNFRPAKATPMASRKYTKGTKADPVPRLYAGQREHDETAEEFQDRVFESVAGGGYFARFEVIRLAHEEEAAARDLWQRAEEMRDAMKLGRWPRNPGSCGLYSRPCSYLPICVGESTPYDGTRYRIAERAHEELAA